MTRWEKENPANNIEKNILQLEQRLSNQLLLVNADARVNHQFHDILFEIRDLLSLINSRLDQYKEKIEKAKKLLAAPIL